MSDTSSSPTPTRAAGAPRESVFVKGFIPGLVVGLVVGLAVGAFAPLLTQEKPAPANSDALYRPSSHVRDERPPDQPRAPTPEDAARASPDKPGPGTPAPKP